MVFREASDRVSGIDLVQCWSLTNHTDRQTLRGKVAYYVRKVQAFAKHRLLTCAYPPRISYNSGFRVVLKIKFRPRS